MAPMVPAEVVAMIVNPFPSDHPQRESFRSGSTKARLIAVAAWKSFPFCADELISASLDGRSRAVATLATVLDDIPARPIEPLDAALPQNPD